MSEEIRELVTRRWAEYGLGALSCTRVLRKVQNPPSRDRRHVVDTRQGWLLNPASAT